MQVEFKLPDIGEGVAEGEIVRWIVKEGDSLKEDQPMVEVMTDKATVEITSPVTGRVAKILKKEGEVAPVHSVIVILEKGGPAAPAPAATPVAAPKPTPAPAAPPTPAPKAPAPVAAPAPAPARVEPAPALVATEAQRVLAAPATRKLARELGVELGAVSGSGPHGRVTKDDVAEFASAPKVGAAPAPTPAPVAAPLATPVVPAPAPAPAPVRTFTAGGEDRIPYRGIRKATGDQMRRSAYTAPHFTYVDEIDMTALYALRKSAAAIGEEQGTKVTFLPFIMKALTSAIRKFPNVNSTLDEEKGEIVVKHDIHVGIATDTDRGLMVPVVRHADQKGVLELAGDLQRLSQAARNGTARRDELIGSTITITSAGSIGGLFATPIINHPEVAILGVYQIKDKPVIKDGAIVPGKIGYLSLTLDHRVVDGGTAAHFVNHMKRLLENPGLLVL